MSAPPQPPAVWDLQTVSLVSRRIIFAPTWELARAPAPAPALTAPNLRPRRAPGAPLSVSATQHNRIGAILDYPPCCVAQWVDELDRPPSTRPGYTARIRDHDEAQRLEAAIAQVLGARVDVVEADRRMRWVLCDACSSRLLDSLDPQLADLISRITAYRPG